jgi:putative membrane protein
MSDVKQPRAFRLEGESAKDTAVLVTESFDPFDPELARAEPEVPALRRWFGLGAIFSAAFGLFLSLAIGLWGFQFVEAAMATSPVLGWIAAALALIALLALIVMGLREWLILRRLQAVETLRQMAKHAYADDDREGARAVVRALLDAMPQADPATRAEMQSHASAIIDGRDLLKIAERTLLSKPDQMAGEAIAAAARRVSIVTAISPRAWVDILFVLAQSVRLIRSIATLYGSKPSGLASFKLFRKVIGHLAITGGVAMTDSILSQVVGAGLAARLSAKLGEGVLNGVLTARVGIAAITVCRPLPFLAMEPPKLADIASKLLQRGL